MLTTWITSWNRIMWRLEGWQYGTSRNIRSSSLRSIVLQTRVVGHECEYHNVSSDGQCQLTYNSQSVGYAQRHETSPAHISKSPPLLGVNVVNVKVCTGWPLRQVLVQSSTVKLVCIAW